MPKRLLTFSRTQPARMIVGVVAWISLVAGIFLLTPYFIPSEFLPFASALKDEAPFVGFLLNTLACIPGIHAFRKNTPESIARGAEWLFAWYLLVTLSRMFVVADPFTLSWVPTLIIALIMGVVYTEQKFVQRATLRGRNE